MKKDIRDVRSAYHIMVDEWFPIDHYRFDDAAASEVADIVRSGRLHHKDGVFVRRFEAEFAQYLGIPWAVSTTSGTTALQMILAAVGVGPEDEVLVPAYTFVSVAEAVVWQGARPVFVDLDKTFNMGADQMESLVSSRTKAVIVAHMFGNPANICAIRQIAHEKGIMVIEDCAQTVGGLVDKKMVGNFGDAAYFSFNIKKPIPLGEGGMAVTKDSYLRKKLEAIRNRGIPIRKKKAEYLGLSAFMTEIQGALGCRVLKDIKRLNENREALYNTFAREVRHKVILPTEAPNAIPTRYRVVWLLPEERAADRDRLLRLAREKRGLPLRAFYPIPLYRHPIFENRNVSCPVAEEICTRQMGFEMSPYLIPEQVERVVDFLHEHRI